MILSGCKEKTGSGTSVINSLKEDSIMKKFDKLTVREIAATGVWFVALYGVCSVINYMGYVPAIL